MSVKDRAIILSLMTVLFLSVIELSLGRGPIDCRKKAENALQRSICFCRKNIFTPICRGLQKRDLMGPSYGEYELPAQDSDNSRDDASKANQYIQDMLTSRNKANPDDSYSEYLK